MRNLDEVLSRRTEQGQDTPEMLRSFNNFLTSFNVQLVHRFPDVTDLQTIDETIIRNVAKFCAVTSIIALDTWLEVITPERQRVVARERKAA